MSIANMSFAEIQEILPARTCIVCEKTIKEIGGRKMVAQPLRGTNVFDRVIHGGFKNFHSCTRLLEDRDLYLVTWGEVTFLSDEVISRIKADYLEGRRPWFCQVCGKRSCHLCGALERRPAMSDYVCDDGYILHCPSLGADTGCLNPQCRRYKHY